MTRPSPTSWAKAADCSLLVAGPAARCRFAWAEEVVSYSAAPVTAAVMKPSWDKAAVGMQGRSTRREAAATTRYLTEREAAMPLTKEQAADRDCPSFFFRYPARGDCFRKVSARAPVSIGRSATAPMDARPSFRFWGSECLDAGVEAEYDTEHRTFGPRKRRSYNWDRPASAFASSPPTRSSDTNPIHRPKVFRILRKLLWDFPSSLRPFPVTRDPSSKIAKNRNRPAQKYQIPRTVNRLSPE